MELQKAQQNELKEILADKTKATSDNDSTKNSNDTSNNTSIDDNKNNDNSTNEDKTMTICAETQDVGNVFEDTKIFFEYVILKDKIHKEYSQLTEISFQVQIRYTRLDGAKMLRVISQTKPITKDRQQVVNNLDMNIMAQHNIKKSARLCEEGDYESARTVTYANAMWMANNNNNNNSNFNSNNNANNIFVSKNLNLDFMMQQQQATEEVSGTGGFSEQADSNQKRARKFNRFDNFSSRMYQQKKE